MNSWRITEERDQLKNDCIARSIACQQYIYSFGPNHLPSFLMAELN